MRRLQIDLNRRNRAGQTPTAYTGPTPVVGEPVVVFEPEDGVCANAVIAAVNPDRCTVALDVDWDSMRDDVLAHTTARTGSAIKAVRPPDSYRTGGAATRGVAWVATAVGGSWNIPAPSRLLVGNRLGIA